MRSMGPFSLVGISVTSSVSHQGLTTVFPWLVFPSLGCLAVAVLLYQVLVACKVPASCVHWLCDQTRVTSDKYVGQLLRQSDCQGVD